MFWCRLANSATNHECSKKDQKSARTFHNRENRDYGRICDVHEIQFNSRVNTDQKDRGHFPIEKTEIMAKFAIYTESSSIRERTLKTDQKDREARTQTRCMCSQGAMCID